VAYLPCLHLLHHTIVEAVSPLAALAGAWVSGRLAQKARAEEQVAKWRGEAAAALGPMVALLLDAEPSLVLNAQLHEYRDPQAAIDGLYERWLKAREPLLVVSFAQQSPELRNMGIRLQAEAEMLLRELSRFATEGLSLDKALGSGAPTAIHGRAMELAVSLAQRLFSESL
jgi:hypothetical protein